MMTLAERIEVCIKLGEALLCDSDEKNRALDKAKYDNVWFDTKNSNQAIQNIASQFLSASKLINWTSQYDMQDHLPKMVGLVLAGNLPLVGFHDVLMVFISGHISKIKLSQKDTALWNYVLELFYAIDPRTKTFIQAVDKLINIDAAIATGSDNSSRYFEYYFGKYPHIIRKNRVGVAVLTGQETTTDLMAIGEDVFQYYGLGCRNISSIFVPRGYDFIPLLKMWESYTTMRDNHAYGNNYDYNYAIFLMNQTHFLANGAIILLESDELISRLACLHYRYYDNEVEVIKAINASMDNIQTIVTHQAFPGLKTIAPGLTQAPELGDFADGVDTMQFLLRI